MSLTPGKPLSKYLFSKDTDPVLVKYKDKINDFAYVTHKVNKMQNIQAKTTFADHARIRDDLKGSNLRVQAVHPSKLLDESLKLEYYNRDTGLSPTEQLYTPRGGQSGGMRSTTVADAAVDPNNYWETLLLENLNFGKTNTYYQKRVIWST